MGVHCSMGAPAQCQGMIETRLRAHASCEPASLKSLSPSDTHILQMPVRACGLLIRVQPCECSSSERARPDRVDEVHGLAHQCFVARQYFMAHQCCVVHQCFLAHQCLVAPQC